MRIVVKTWIIISAVIVGSGWILSAFHELNRIGYIGVSALAIFIFVIFPKGTTRHVQTDWRQPLKKARRRFKRLAPLLFLVLVFLSLMAGLLYAPADGDSNAYRIPRVLHWLGAGQWHWITTSDIRMNISGCGFEWLSAPLILFTDSFRFIFLINWLSFVLLPGLIYSVFTRLQVRPRVAWWWMWLLPSSWCYVMQAAGVINDSFAVIYALASVDFALRARDSQKTGDLWLSLTAAALLTGTKQTIIPLALVCAVAIAPRLNLLVTRWMGTIWVLAGCLLVSAAPLFFFNKEHAGTWLGIPPNAGPQAMFWARCQPDSPLWGVIGNAFCLPLQNLEPPFFPWAGHWNEMMKHFQQTPLGAHFVSFEDFGRLPRAITEGDAGVGLGICGLIFISGLAACWHRSFSAAPKNDLLLRGLRWAPWVALIVFMAKVGSHSNARQLAPYYVFFFPLILTGAGHACLVRRRWWQILGWIVMSATAILLVVSRERPLFPAQSIITILKRSPAPNIPSVMPLFLATVNPGCGCRWGAVRLSEYSPMTLPPGFTRRTSTMLSWATNFSA